MDNLYNDFYPDTPINISMNSNNVTPDLKNYSKKVQEDKIYDIFDKLDNLCNSNKIKNNQNMKNIIDRQVERQIEELSKANNPFHLNSTIKTTRARINRSKSNPYNNKTPENLPKNQLIDLKN